MRCVCVVSCLHYSLLFKGKEEEEKTERGRNALERKVIRKFFFRF